MEKRPKRLQITNELGKPQTLAQGEAAFTVLRRAPGPVLVLGLGPCPETASAVAAQAAAFAPSPSGTPAPGEGVSYVESEEFASQMTRAWREAIPAGFTRLSPDEAPLRAHDFGTIVLFAQNPRLFPSFWGPILAALALARLPGPDAGAKKDAVILPAGEKSLLARELAEAFSDLGRTVLTVDPADASATLPDLLASGSAGLFCSVNFACLDPLGQSYYMMRAAGVAVAVWCVDNPFHLISGLKAPFWREATLFVTDDWFCEPLRRAGARRVHHLPLAASEAFFSPPPLPRAPLFSGLSEKIVFVGRSRFPGRDAFFAGQSVSPELQAKALRMIAAGKRPDYGWWTDRLAIASLWPGNAVRAAGLGAETANLAFRRACLGAALPLGLAVFGDAAWREELPAGADLRPEVDYYGPLSSLYREAKYSLNATSLLLPRGLTQRHFDVFAAGGRLLTDATPGLALFPRELIEPFSYAAPGDIPATVNRLEGDQGLRDDLARAMRAHIFERHRYGHRARTICELSGWEHGDERREALDGRPKGD